MENIVGVLRSRRDLRGHMCKRDSVWFAALRALLPTAVIAVVLLPALQSTALPG